ncbi:MAG: hypothetical protein IPJ51_09960 [Saprospiraceae bacterium]|jgi:hypothetical protein|nr:hypothetical protein [Saprospiraceae bacterium]
MANFFKNFENLSFKDSSKTICGGDTGTTKFDKMTSTATNWSYQSYDPTNYDGSSGDWNDRDACK